MSVSAADDREGNVGVSGEKSPGVCGSGSECRPHEAPPRPWWRASTAERYPGSSLTEGGLWSERRRRPTWL